MTNDDTPAPRQPQRVERTGIALVHEGERIYPAEDSAAPLEPLSASVVNYYFPVEIEYYFPVEIEVIGDAGTGIAEQIFEALRLHIEALV